MTKHGAGSLRLLPTGTYEYRVTIGGVRRAFYGTEDAVRLAAAQARQDHRDGVARASRETVAQFLVRWLRAGKSHWDYNTYATYETTCRLHLIPALGKIELRKLEVRHVEQWKERELQDYTRATVGRYRSILIQALMQAEREGVVLRNVARLSLTPKADSRERVPFDAERARRFFALVRGTDDEAYWMVAALLGMRSGEVRGLRWQDVDLTTGIVQVRRQVQREDGRFVLKDLKTARSRRTLRLPPVALTALVAHRRRQAEQRLAAGPAWEDWGLVFTTARGTPIHGQVMNSRFHRLLRTLAMPDESQHMLRHFVASILPEQGIAPAAIQAQLGHATSDMTDRYTHAFTGAADVIAATLERLFGESNGEPAPTPDGQTHVRPMVAGEKRVGR